MKQFSNLMKIMEKKTIKKNVTSPKSNTSSDNLNSKKMKNFVYFFIVGSMLFLFKTTNAQINLVHTFDESVTWTGSIYMEQNLYPTNSYYSASVVDNSYVVKIYNTDYSVNANNTYNFTPPAGYKVSSVSMSREIFNTDNNYEFLVKFVRTDNTYDNTREKSILYNQNGSIIKDFGFAYMVNAYPYLHIANNNFRLIVNKYYYDGTIVSIETEIYSVPGTPPSGVANLKSSEYQSPYPNPANLIITLPYQLKQGEMSIMNIYNTNGQLIETKHIDFLFDKILLNVSNYTKGVYLYEVNGISNRFIVN